MDPKFAILADIHANLEALNAVVEDARSQSVTDFYCLGDVVGYNANPQECIDIIRDICAKTVCGNHDFYCSHEKSLDDFQPHAAAVIDWTRRQLNDRSIKWLAELQLSFTSFPNSFTLVHGTLDMPELWGYVFDTFDAEVHFTYQQTAVCFHGHTHVPVIFEKSISDVNRYQAPESGTRVSMTFGHKYFINVGSVGQPRDEIPMSSYLIFEPKTKTFEFRRVAYDIETAAEKVIKAGLPARLADRLKIGR